MNLDSLGARLREARKALGKNQDQMAATCGVSREMWGKYERGIAMPGGDVLKALFIEGSDVRYILTGDRDGPPPVVLNEDEETMLRLYRSASKDVRRAAIGALRGGAPETFEGSQQVFHKAIKGDVAGRDIVKGGGKR